MDPPNWGQHPPNPNHYTAVASTQFVAAPPVHYQTLTWSGPMIPGYKTQELWSTGLFDCWMDFRSCFTTCICPCITFGQIAEIADEGNTSCGSHGGICVVLACWFIPCLYTCFVRSKIRRKYKLKEVPCWDWIVHCLFLPCALCQEYRELEQRGFKVSAGWEENVKRQNKGLAIAPIAPPVVYIGMKR